MGYENSTVKDEGVETGSGLAIRLTDGSSALFLDRMAGLNCIDAYDYKFDLE